MDEERSRAHGALTGESGSVTPPQVDEEFVPAERRVMEQTIHDADGAPDPESHPADEPALPAAGATAAGLPQASEDRIDPQQDRY